MCFDVLAVHDESLRGMLKDERLQKEILAVDTADDREKVKCGSTRLAYLIASYCQVLAKYSRSQLSPTSADECRHCSVTVLAAQMLLHAT